MVQLFIKSPTPGSTPEWMLVELQGMLESPDNEELIGRFIGDLHFNQKGIPILIIGHHILYGKVADLEKPFIVLMKNEKAVHAMETAESRAMNDTEVTDISQTQGGEDDDAYYVASAVIKRKIVFKTRPKPIITNVAKKV